MNNSAILTSALLAVALGASAARAQLDLGVPTDDVWCYRHAADPGNDPVIRIWGDGTNELNPTGYPGLEFTQDYFSYGFASWDLSSVPRNYPWNGATITITVAPDTNYDPAANDVYLRLITDSFDERTWIFGQGPHPVAGEMNRIVGDDSRAANGAGSTITFRIPRNIPSNVLQMWARTRTLNVAFTSDCDFANERQILRIGTSENVLYHGPQLVLQ